MEKKYLYVMMSRTDTGIAKMIRMFTHAQYNHVSLSLDDSFHGFVSFARYTQDVALAGGYVNESAERFLCSGSEIPVKIFRIEITKEQHAQLTELFSKAGNRDTGLIYNSLGAALTPLHIYCHVNGAYTCLEFACTVLGVPCTTLQALEAYLEPYGIYTGHLASFFPEIGESSDPYFNRRGFFRGFGDTALHMIRLAGRALHITHCNDPVAAYASELCTQ